MPVTSSVAGNARPTQLVDLALQGGGSHARPVGNEHRDRGRKEAKNNSEVYGHIRILRAQGWLPCPSARV